MITVSIERRVKSVTDILPMLRELRKQAMEAQGYVTGETFIGAEDRSLVTVMLTWNSMKEWEQWEASEIRVELYKQIRPLLLEEPHVRVYRYLSYQKKPKEDKEEIFEI